VILVVDNYDSFTWSVVQLLGELGAEPEVHRNDALDVPGALAKRPHGIVISPGPGTPADAGISVPLVRAATEYGIPLLGICLGHQSIGEAFGATVGRADRLMHGKVGKVEHTGEDLFQQLPSPFAAARYHSLVVRSEGLPPCLRVQAWSGETAPGEEIMGLRHVERPIFGVQFHPESVATEHGRTLLRNFLNA
jgi:anthranilate synthase component 2